MNYLKEIKKTAYSTWHMFFKPTGNQELSLILGG